MQSAPRLALLDLPDEMLTGVLLHTSTFADLFRVRATCRRLRAASDDDAVWRTLLCRVKLALADAAHPLEINAGVDAAQLMQRLETPVCDALTVLLAASARTRVFTLPLTVANTDNVLAVVRRSERALRMLQRFMHVYGARLEEVSLPCDGSETEALCVALLCAWPNMSALRRFTVHAGRPQHRTLEYVEAAQRFAYVPFEHAYMSSEDTIGLQFTDWPQRALEWPRAERTVEEYGHAHVSVNTLLPVLGEVRARVSTLLCVS